MKHVLIVTTGFAGVLNCCFELAQRLQSDGFRVTIASPWDIAVKVSKQGLSYVQLPESNLNTHLLLKHNSYGSWNILNPFRRRHIIQSAIDSLGVSGFQDILNTLKIDAVLLEIELPAHIIVASQTSIPIVLFSQWLSIWKTKGHPSITTDIIPIKSRKNTIQIAFSWFRIQINNQKFKISKTIRYAGMHRYSILKRLRKQYFNVKISNVRFYNAMAIPISFMDLPILCLSMFELEFFPSKPKFLHYVGPMVQASRHEELPVSLSNFIHANDASKLIYCSFSSMDRGNAYLIEKLMTVLAEMPDCSMVVSLGNNISIDYFNEIPENVLLLNWVPQIYMLSHAQLSINHAGINTIHECIHFKVPMLIYSGGKYDQDGCAARVHFHTLGLMAKSDDTIDKMREDIYEVLSNPIYKNAMLDFHTRYLDYRKNRILEPYLHQ